MARTTHVAKAQQRYETVPVIDPETGQPKKTPVMRDGEQKMTRAKPGRPARPVFMTVTIQDKTKPKPLYRCDSCGKDIEIGTPYKHITPKSGPYGGTKRTRHESCPSWQVWDYSNSLSAQLARISHDFSTALETVETPDDVQSALDDAASSVEEIADAKEEAGQNIEDGFEHETEGSMELKQIGDDLRTWAEEIKSADIPDLPEPDMVSKWYVNGPDAQSLNEDGFEAQEDAESALEQHLAENEDEDEDDWDIEEVEEDAEEISEEQLDEWRSEVSDTLTIVDESPV